MWSIIASVWRLMNKKLLLMSLTRLNKHLHCKQAIKIKFFKKILTVARFMSAQCEMNKKKLRKWIMRKNGIYFRIWYKRQDCRHGSKSHLNNWTLPSYFQLSHGSFIRGLFFSEIIYIVSALFLCNFFVAYFFSFVYFMYVNVKIIILLSLHFA